MHVYMHVHMFMYIYMCKYMMITATYSSNYMIISTFKGNIPIFIYVIIL